jgi:hypothetical protein
MLDKGWDVTVLSRGNEKPVWFDRVTRINADRRTPDAFASLSGYFDVVVDFVAYQLEDVHSVAERSSRASASIFL